MIKKLCVEAFSSFPDSYMTEGEKTVSYSEFEALVSSYSERIVRGECVMIKFPASKIDSAAIILACLFKGGIVILLPHMMFEEEEKLQKRFPHSYLYNGKWNTVSDKEKYVGRYPSEARVILFTSGTTAQSKGVILTEKNLVSTVLAGNERFPVAYQSRIVSILPLYHAFGLNVGFLALFLRGCSFSFADYVDYFELVRRVEPEYFFITPELLSVHNRFARLYGREFSFGSRGKYVFCGGNFLNESEKDISESYGISVFISYGLTECSPSVSAETYNLRRTGSVGKPISCTSVEIINDEIVVNGDNVAYGYDGGPLFRGRFYTGDIGYIDDDGFLFIIGRIRNLISFNDGTKVCPEQVESIINGIPEIYDSLVSRAGERFDVKIYISENVDVLVVESKIKRLLPSEHNLATLTAVYEPFATNAAGKKMR